MSLSEVPAYPGDLILHMESEGYCCEKATIRNGTGASVVLENYVGLPLKAGTNGADYNIAKATEEANVIALLVKGPCGHAPETLANNTTSSEKYLVLARAPAIINKDAIPDNDLAGVAYTKATIVTALKALKFVVKSEPANEESMSY